MDKIFLPLIWLAKSISFICKTLHLGAGGTWAGHIALFFCPTLLRRLEDNLVRGSVLITGTNGKTTTAKMLVSIFKKENRSVVFNPTGANLLNGITSALIADVDFWGRPRSEMGVFEIDEAAFPKALEMYDPEVVVILNLFRDQLDRYGEIDLTAEKIHQALKGLSKDSVVVLNADNDYVAPLGKDLQARVLYFGYDVSRRYSDISSSHFEFCNLNFEISLGGSYTIENALAAITVAKSLGVEYEVMQKALKEFRPAFGRQEEFEINGKKVKILLSKNPEGFNQNVKMLQSLEKIETLLLVLNDNIPDGRDVSWIWDTDPANLLALSRFVIVSGSRAEDMGLRLKYSWREIPNSKFQIPNKFQITNDLKEAIRLGLERTPKDETFYIMPTYSAMLDVRKILTGRKIL